MSLRLEMLQVARLAPSLLHESATLVEDFLRSQIAEDGGFRDRGGRSDLYYTVFGLEGLTALRAELPADPAEAYLRRFGDGEGLDFVHLACLARCWANLRGRLPDERARGRILARLEAYRSRDGGYQGSSGAAHGTAYGCFLALGAYQDLGADLPDTARLFDCLDALASADGGVANRPGMPVGSTPATAAAATLYRQIGRAAPPGLTGWLLAHCHQDGGFFAAPSAPMPDLLSTATALHALSGLHASIEGIREPCLDFLDSLWTSRGAFFGHWGDDTPDCEYTYYGLLALGHLSV